MFTRVVIAALALCATVSVARADFYSELDQVVEYAQKSNNYFTAAGALKVKLGVRDGSQWLDVTVEIGISPPNEPEREIAVCTFEYHVDLLRKERHSHPDCPQMAQIIQAFPKFNPGGVIDKLEPIYFRDLKEWVRIQNLMPRAIVSLSRSLIRRLVSFSES
jgi:hypothetical protein